MTTPDGAPGERFRRHPLKRGYKVAEVDEFLDRVAGTLTGSGTGTPLTPEDVHEVVFRVRFGGYDEWEVDKHLDRLERQLAAGGPLTPGDVVPTAGAAGDLDADDDAGDLDADDDAGGPDAGGADSDGEHPTAAEPRPGAEPPSDAHGVGSAHDADEPVAPAGAETTAAPPDDVPATVPDTAASWAPPTAARPTSGAGRVLPRPFPGPDGPGEQAWRDQPPGRHGTRSEAPAPATAEQSSPFTAEDQARLAELRATFTTRRFGSGYDVGQVDRVFDAVAARFAGRGATPEDAADLRTSGFDLVQGGYFEAEVDAALAEVRATLQRRLT